MCHQTVRPNPSGPSPASGGAAAAPSPNNMEQNPAAAAEEEEEQGQENSAETQSEAVTPDQNREEEKEQRFEAGDGEREEKEEPQREAVQGLRFSSSGDFVGFVGPATSCSESSQAEERTGADSPTQTTLNAAEPQSDSDRAKMELTSRPTVPQNGESCEETSESWSIFGSNPEAAGTSLAESRSSVKSCRGRCELSGGSDDPQTNSSSDELKLSPHRPSESPAAAQTHTTDIERPASVP